MDLFEDDSQLQILIDRTWDLHVRLNQEINQEGFSFCSHCSNHGRFCVVAEKTQEERYKIIAIRDSLQDLHNILIYMQTLKECHKMKRDEALSRLEESRMHLIERMNEWSEKNRRQHHVIEELIKFIGDGKTAEETEEKIEKQKNVNGVYSFIVGSVRFGVEFLVMFASISSAVQLYRSRKKTGFQASVDSRKLEFIITDSKIELDVLCGRG